ncbi:MAG: AsmA-like C-terminal region-containing protein, partial [Candidatus Gastranaerophilales bacterium]|nr:AsmA-like C-terminal region-containing protein [Candidatus Gastranaerophilales bacterium]
SKINIKSELDNNIYNTPEILSLKISAEQIDNDKLLSSLAKTKQALQNNGNKETKNFDFSNLQIKNGILDIKKFTLKSLIAENISTNFSIDKTGTFYADDINVNVGQGNIEGKLSFDLNNSILKGDFEVQNVDANYMAETLFAGRNQIYGNASGKIILETRGLTDEEIIKNLQGFMYFDISDGRMPKLGSLEYLLRAGNIIKSGISGFTLNSILELLNLVKTGYFSNINGSCSIENGIAKNIEIFSKGENLSLYIHGTYDIAKTSADMEILGKLSKNISTIFGALGNTSLNTFFKLIPGISIFDFSRKNFVEDVEKIPAFTNGYYESRVFQAIINGNINDSGYVQSFKWVK